MFVWQGQGTPTPLYALLDGFALDGNWSPNDPGASASDGLGDPQMTGFPYTQSMGKHLVQKTAPAGSGYGTLLALDGVTLSAGTGSGGFLNVSLTAQPDTRFGRISTSLGTTFHKSTTQFDSNGVALPEADGPDDDGMDGTTFATTVIPQPNGPGATTLPDGDAYSIITYTVTPIGSWGANSSYHWATTIGDISGSSEPADGTFTMPGDPPYSVDATYRAQALANGGNSENVTVALKDANDGATATPRCIVNFHPPVDNWQPQGSAFQVAPIAYGSSDGPQPANGYVNISVQAPGEVDWSTPSHVGGGLLTVAGGVIAVAQPETSPVVIGLLGAGGYTLGLVTPPAPTIYPVQGTQGQFTSDVGTQESIKAGNTSGIFMPTVSRMSNSLADAASTSGDYAGYFNGANGTLSFNAVAYQLRWQRNFLGDGYGAQGYVGAVPGNITYPGSIQYVFDWTIAAPGNPSGH